MCGGRKRVAVRAGLLPQRQDAPAAALAQYADVVETRRREIVQGQTDQIRDPKAGDRVGSGGVEQGPDLGMVGVINGWQIGLLLGQGVHLCRQIEAFRVAEFQVAEEGLDGGDTRVAGPHAAATVGLEVLEKGEQRLWVEVPDLQLARSDRVAPRVDDRQQFEAGGIARNGMRAGTAIERQVLPQEGRQRPDHQSGGAG